VSQENLEIARRALTAAMRTPPDVATVDALFHRDHVFVDRQYDSVEGEREWVGARGFQEHTALREEAWSELGVEIDDVRALDDDRVLLVASMSGRGRQSGAPFQVERCFLATVRAGRVVRTEFHASPKEALKAVGLEE
jgi:ketosteroid isomerase-like protein